MGINLAKEVKTFVKDWCYSKGSLKLTKLSFISHSLGGLIARSALPLLSEYK